MRRPTLVIMRKTASKWCLVAQVAKYIISMSNMLQYQGPLLLTSIEFNHSMDYKYINHQVWNEITYSLSNFNGVTVEVCEWISNSSHALLGICLLINAWIKVNLCC